MIHVYAFVERLEDVPSVAGLDGATVERLCVEEVDAVFSRRSHGSSRDTLRDDAVVHGSVVEALRDRAAVVLPVRFGETLPDEEALAESLRARLPGLRRAFDRVRGCVEIAVHAHDRIEPDNERPASGAAYMRLRAAEEARRQESIDTLERVVGALARDSRLERDRRSVAYLVDSDRLDDVRAVVDRFASDRSDLAVVCTGPWAPFSFGEDAA